MTHRPHRPHKFRALSKPKQLHKREHKHYLPYLPLLVLVAGTLLINLVQPMQRRGVLAYATNVSQSGLLSATNKERLNKGAPALQPNSSLAAAAQAKANDMIARNYWSHNTPDGKEPWIFIDQTGYKYQKAGENLAYGFLTSDDTVTGWMNSQTHRDNLLDSNFTEVGFGFSNGENFNSNGEETVVVAMYGKPQVLATINQPAPAPTPAPAVATKPDPSTQIVTETIAPAAPIESNKLVEQPTTTERTTADEPASKPVARVQLLVGGESYWALFGIGLIAGLSIMFMLLKHAAGLRHLIKGSERFVLHHPLLDTFLISVVLLSSFMSQTTGFIR